MTANAASVGEIQPRLDSVEAYAAANALINAEARLSTLGGARLTEEVLAAMSAANRVFLDFRPLEQAVCDRLALLTRNESAAVSNGACAGLILSTLACIRTRAPGGELTKEAMRKARVVVPADGISPYLDAIDPLIGGIEIGGSIEDCERILAHDRSGDFVAIVDTAGRGRSAEREKDGTQHLSALARRHGIGLVIDAAAQLPPTENLWSYTVGWGATCAVFSGGKELGGPQTSGLVVGEQWICDSIREIAFPHEGIARGYKVGRGELVGLLVAVAAYLRIDQEARLGALEQVVSTWLLELSHVPGLRSWREYPNEAGQPIPRLGICLDPARQPALIQALERKQIRLAEDPDRPGVLFITPEMLTGEEVISVMTQLKEGLSDA
jgi:L-seryl-tRNA(Ser) seleniumtransferase